MSGIEDLRQRVEAAEKRFGLINETHAKYSGRLISLMNAVESRILEQQDEIARHTSANEQHAAKIEHSEQENEELRTMLHSLLQAIEADSQDKLAEAMQLLDQKASALVGVAVEDETPTEVAEAPEPEMAAAPEPVAEAASDDAAESMEHAPEETAAEVEMAAEVYGPEKAAEPEPVAEAASDDAAEAMKPTPEEPAAEAVEEPETEPVEDAAEPAAGSEGPVEEVHVTEPDKADAMAETAADADAQAEPQTAEGEEAVPESSLAAIMQRVTKLVDENTDTAEKAKDPAKAAE